MRDPCLYFHFGLHKTGTSSLQFFLRNIREKLYDNGYIYPQSTISTGSGHTNFAWALSGDRRYRLDQGSLKDLHNEILNYDDHAIISSEDLSALLLKPNKLRILKNFSIACNKKPCCVVYFRNQADYFESLFHQMVFMGYGSLPELLIEDAIISGQNRLREWVFHFDYLNITNMLIKIFGYENTYIRFYDNLNCDDVVEDFFKNVLEEEVEKYKFPVQQKHNNRSSIKKTINNFVYNRTKVQFTECGKMLQTSSYLATMIPYSKLHISNPARNLFKSRFEKNNEELCKLLQIDSECLSLNSDEDQDFGLDGLFTNNMVMDILYSPQNPASAETIAQGIIDRAMHVSYF